MAKDRLALLSCLIPLIVSFPIAIQAQESRLRGGVEFEPLTGKHLLEVMKLEQDAALGKVEAQYELGKSFKMGLGCPQSFIRASYWFLKAANRGHHDAQGELGLLYMNGQGVEQNPILAYKWLDLAATEGDGWWKSLRDKSAEHFSLDILNAAQQAAVDWTPDLSVKAAQLSNEIK